jgi:protein O-GlcNAc transferase
VLRSLGQEELADECADKAGSLQPDSAQAKIALAAAQYDQGNIAEALETYREVMLTSTPSADARAAYAHALLADGRNEEAIEQLHRAVSLRDKDLAIRWALVMAPLKTVYKSETDRIASREAFARGLQEVREWYERTTGIESAFAAVGVSQPFLLAYHPQNNRELLSSYGRLCVDFMATLKAEAVKGAKKKPIVTPAAGDTSSSGRKLRLGVVAAHVGNHSVWIAITQGWLRNIDHERFDVHLFHLDGAAMPAGADARASADIQLFVAHFDAGPRDLAGWIQAVKDADLDVILYPEIGMHANTLKLACLRLAPVQAAAWGHPETTGLPTIDLYISATAIEPAGAAENYTERLVTLPNLGVYAEPLKPEIRVPSLRALRLPSDEPLLLCPGMPFKYGPRFDEVWVQIARQLGKKRLFRRGGGRLVFFKGLGEARNGMLERRLRATFDSGGLDFDAHVRFVPTLERPDFFGLMRQAVLMLDTPGFSGFNTAIQAIECGLPVLAFEGELMRGRLASGVMRQLDLPQLVATGAEEFVKKAVDLAQDPDALKVLREKIAARRDALFHDVAPVRALESCLIDAVASARTPTTP